MSSLPMKASAACGLFCRSCGTEQLTEGWCTACGPARLRYRSSDRADQPGAMATACAECGAPGSGAERATAPLSCRSCASPDLGWRDPSTGQWVPEPLPVAPGEGPWICGDFDADCVWRTPAGYSALGSDSGNLLANSLPLGTITRAQLENTSLVDAPPAERSDDDARAPIRLDTLHDVYVYRQQGDELRLYQVSLTDLRLHGWQQTLQTDIGESATHGRLQGKAYARLVLKPEQRPRLQPPAEARRWLARVVPSEQELAKAIAAEGRYCNTCNLFLMAAVFLLLFLACDWLSGLLGVAAMALQCRWRASRMRDGRNRMPRWMEIGVGTILVGLAVLLYLGIRGPACDGRGVYGWLAGIALMLLLTALLRRCWPWLLVTLVWVLALLAYFCGARPHCSVAERPQVTAPSAASAPMPASGAGAMPGAPPAVNGAVPAAGGDSGWRWPSLPELNPMPALANAADKLRDGAEQLISHDADAQRVEDQSTGNGRVSVDQALRQPDRYFSCDPRRATRAEGGEGAPRSYSIYLGEAALFDKDSAVLGPGADPHLRKLARLLERRPDARLILTGHADSSGQRDHNLLLSQRRADAVADWLTTHAALPPERLEIRAAGDRQPLVDEPGLYRLNRRVEVTLDCSGRVPS